MAKNNKVEYKAYVGRLFTCRNVRDAAYDSVACKYISGKDLGVVLVLDEKKQSYGTKSYKAKVFSTSINREVWISRSYLQNEIVDESDLDKTTCLERTVSSLSKLDSLTSERVPDIQKIKDTTMEAMKYLRMLQKQI
jgi:hypothetical protein